MIARATSPAGPAHPEPRRADGTFASTGRLSPLSTREERLAQRFPRATQFRVLVGERWPHIARASSDADMLALESRCATRGTAPFARDCIAWADAAGKEPHSVGLFARCMTEIPETPEPRAAGADPQAGDPDFNDPAAWSSTAAYLARDAGAAPPLEGGAVRRVEV